MDKSSVYAEADPGGSKDSPLEKCLNKHLWHLIYINFIKRLNYFRGAYAPYDLETYCSMAKRHNNRNSEVSDQG